jgi:glucose/arabinose dehydrogenase
VVWAGCEGSPEGQSQPGVRLVPVGGAFTAPTYVTAASGGQPRGIYVLEQAGTVVHVSGRTRTTFADLTDRVSCCDSLQGLLSMTFDPDWQANRRVYFFYTGKKRDLVLARFRASPDGARIIPSSFHSVLHFARPKKWTHNGGQLAFGPDGDLYVSIGDAGVRCDPFGNAQDLTTPFGKVSRVDPRTGATFTLMYGLRNPWRFSFDRETGDFWVADVGEKNREEIDYLSASELSRGALWNGGWNVREGDVESAVSGCEPEPLAPEGTLLEPLFVYRHDAGRCAVTGGYVYRGRRLPISGSYVYGDFCSGEIWALQREPDGSGKNRLLLSTDLLITSFGEDARGELYVADGNGAVYRLAPST